MAYPNEPPLPGINQVADLHECIGATIERAWNTDDEIAIRFTDGRVFFARLKEAKHQDERDYIETEVGPDAETLARLGIMSEAELKSRRDAQADWDRRCREGAERTEYLKLKAKFEGGSK